MHIAVLGPANPAEFIGDLATLGPYPKGMGGRPVNGLVRSLLDLGHIVTLITGEPAGDAIWRGFGSRLTVISVPFRARARTRALDRFDHERKLIAEELLACHADVYHAHWTYEFALACIDARVKPLLVTAHDAPVTVLRHVPDPYRLMRVFMALEVSRSIVNLTAVSPYLALRWRREMLYRKPIAVISNPIPPLTIGKRLERSNAVILDIANSSNLKNVKKLLLAFKIVRFKNPASELRLVGDGLESGGAMFRWAVRKGIDANVSFLGVLSRDDVSRQFTEASIFCHPSLEESQGMALLEAMASGVHVIAGERSGAVPWTLFDGRAGILANVRDPRSIARSINSAIENPLGALRMSNRAKDLIQTRFSPELIAGSYIVEYKKLINDRVGKPQDGRSSPQLRRLPVDGRNHP